MILNIFLIFQLKNLKFYKNLQKIKRKINMKLDPVFINEILL